MLLRRLKGHNVWLFDEAITPTLRVQRNDSNSSVGPINWPDYQEIIIQLLQENGQMREILQHIHEHPTHLANNLNLVDSYIESHKE